MVAIKKTKKQPTPGFKNKLVSLSRYNTCPRVTKEWRFFAYYMTTSQYMTCPGDPRKITHICVIISEHNHNQLEICNSCAERYMDLFEGGKIENDVRRVKSNIGLSMSQMALDYLRDSYAISNYEYEGYMVVKGVRSDSDVLRFRSDINRKLLALTDYNNKSALDTIDLILVWIHRNTQSNMDVKALFEMRNNLLTTNVCNADLLKSIIIDNKIDAINYSQIERGEAYKIFEPYLQVWNRQYRELSAYFYKDPNTQALIEVPKKVIIRKEKPLLTYNLDLEPDTIKEGQYKDIGKQSHRISSKASVIIEESIIETKDNIAFVDQEEAYNKSILNPDQKENINLDKEPDVFFPVEALGKVLQNAWERRLEYDSLSEEEKKRRTIEEQRLKEERKLEQDHFRNRMISEERTVTSELLASDTIQKISAFILEYWKGLSHDSPIDDIISELDPVFEKLMFCTIGPNPEINDIIWDEHFNLRPTITCLYDLLSQLDFRVVKHLLTLLLCKYANALRIPITDIMTISIVRKLIDIFSTEEMEVQCTGKSRPLEYYAWEIGPTPDPDYYVQREFRKNEIKDIDRWHIKDMISESISIEDFFDYFNQWIVYLAETDSLKEILFFLDVGTAWIIYDLYPRVTNFREHFDYVSVKCFNDILEALFRKYPDQIAIRVEQLNSFFGDDCALKYDPKRKLTFFERVENKRRDMESIKAQIRLWKTVPVEDDVKLKPIDNIRTFDYLLTSSTDSNKGSVNPEIERKWIESCNQSIEGLKQSARNLNKLEKETDILILDSITSRSLEKLNSFISKYLKQLTSSNSIQAFVLTFDHIEINDVYESNPNITSLFECISKLSLGCIKKVLTQLLSQRLNKSKVSISEIPNNQMVLELMDILLDENLELKYTGYGKPILSSYWRIEPKLNKA